MIVITEAGRGHATPCPMSHAAVTVDGGEYQALYRKYRPQTFDDVIGQGHVTTTLA